MKRIEYNPLEEKLQFCFQDGTLEWLYQDPVTKNNTAWVLITVDPGTGGGKMLGFMGLGTPLLTVNVGGSTSNQLSFKNRSGVIQRFDL